MGWDFHSINQVMTFKAIAALNEALNIDPQFHLARHTVELN